MLKKEYDLFISHANKDKLTYVNDLYQALSQLGINIFYDKDSISWGDNWKKKIFEGTETAEFAIIVISEKFFGREWTEKELHEFLSRQNDSGQKIILPLLLDVTQEQLKNKYPQLEDIHCLNTKDYDFDNITVLFAKEFIKRLKENFSIKIVSSDISDIERRKDLKEEILKLVNIGTCAHTSHIAEKLGIEPKEAWELLRELCMHDKAITTGGPITENDFDRNIWLKKN